MGKAYGNAIRSMVYVVEMPDGSRWGVPVEVIALDRAKNYADEFDGNVARSLEEDTWPLFEADSYDVSDWAGNNMNWEDVEAQAQRIHDPDGPVDYQEGWVNGEKEFRDPGECPGWKEQ